MLHQRVNIKTTPIANKYCEGKMKTTPKGELKGAEIAFRETNPCSNIAVGGRIRSGKWRDCLRRFGNGRVKEFASLNALHFFLSTSQHHGKLEDNRVEEVILRVLLVKSI